MILKYHIIAEALVVAQSSATSPQPNVQKRQYNPSFDDLCSEDERRIAANESSDEDTSSG